DWYSVRIRVTFFFKLSKKGINGFLITFSSKDLMSERRFNRISSAPPISLVRTCFSISFEKLLTFVWLPTPYWMTSVVDVKLILSLYCFITASSSSEDFTDTSWHFLSSSLSSYVVESRFDIS